MTLPSRPSASSVANRRLAPIALLAVALSTGCASGSTQSDPVDGSDVQTTDPAASQQRNTSADEARSETSRASRDGATPTSATAPANTPATDTSGEATEHECSNAASSCSPSDGSVDSQRAAEPPSKKTQLAKLPKGTTVLHVGDSFAGALGYELNKALEAHGVKGILKYEKSTYIPTWASNRALPQYLDRYQPDLILITLGANELQIPDPSARAETVRRVVKRFGSRPCVWIGIPLWQDADPTLMEVIRNNVAPCLYLDSTALMPDMPRAKDKIHPSVQARTDWAHRVVKWLQERQEPTASEWQWRK